MNVGGYVIVLSYCLLTRVLTTATCLQDFPWEEVCFLAVSMSTWPVICFGQQNVSKNADTRSEEKHSKSLPHLAIFFSLYNKNKHIANPSGS